MVSGVQCDGYAGRHTFGGQVRRVLDLSAYSSRPYQAHRSRSSGAGGTTSRRLCSQRDAGVNMNATEGSRRGGCSDDPDVDLYESRCLSLDRPVWPVALAAVKRHAC